MNKLFALLGAGILLSGISFAYINESATSDLNILKGQGYSDSMLRVVDTARYHDTNGTYQRHYGKSRKKLGRSYSVIKTYVDPVQDDGLFGEHQINFSNSWDWGQNKYSGRYKKVESIENL